MADRPELLVVGGAEVRRALPMAVCIETIERVMRAVSRGDAWVPLRTVMPVAASADPPAAQPPSADPGSVNPGSMNPGSMSLFAVMPGYLGDPRALVAKILALYPENPQRGLSSHLGLVTCFDATTGQPLAVMDASAVTALRTAAASAVATRALAREDAGVLAILGTGEQAAPHAEAIALVRPLKAIRLWGRSPEKARALAQELKRQVALPVAVCDSARAAVAGADILCTVTAAIEPILEGDWLAPGTHVNLVGASRRHAREADDAVVMRSRFFVDLRASALAEAGELHHARAAGLISESHLLGEIGAVLAGQLPGRISDADITVYKSVGIAAQDLGAAHVIYERSFREGIGTRVPF